MSIAFRELGILGNLLEDLEHPWASLLDVVLRSAVVRVNPRITVRMEVGDKLQISLIHVNEVANSLGLFLGERLSPSVALRAHFVALILCLRAEPGVDAEVNSVVPIEVNSSLFW